MKLWLSTMEVEVSEVDGLFDMLDTGDGKVSFDEFIKGLMRMRGYAKGVDIVSLLYESRKILYGVRQIEGHLASRNPDGAPSSRSPSKD